MDVVDIWVNLVTEQSSAAFLGQSENAHIPGYLGSNQGPTGVDKLLGINASVAGVVFGVGMAIVWGVSRPIGAMTVAMRRLTTACPSSRTVADGPVCKSRLSTAS